MSIYDFEIKTINGDVISMSDFKNKVLLIVNVASKCGFTSQYEALEALYQKYKERGLVILGFPCNQFLNQEPLGEDEIKEFCSLTYGVTFPMFAKIDVNGKNTHPLYKYLKEAQKGLWGSEAIKWNFTKFLVDKNGHVINRFAPATKPEALEVDILVYL
ncbi:glutathione peroxidase [Sulfurospirillum oryzae]|uniref:glutathione peroxidase n=1 Tax=Sulfurospirillum oryzae TaxID=2976535 RepID=UPI0021E96636|nr:glutathione peroxidase [Sulfurospirillum oryzae]